MAVGWGEKEVSCGAMPRSEGGGSEKTVKRSKEDGEGGREVANSNSGKERGRNGNKGFAKGFFRK